MVDLNSDHEDESEQPGDVIRTKAEIDRESAKEARLEMLLKGPIRTTLWTLTWPALVAMCIDSIYAIADASIIGRMKGQSGLAAVSFATPLESGLVGALALVVGSGVAPLYSAALGQKDFDRCNALIANAILLSFFFAIFLACLTPLTRIVLELFGASEVSGILSNASNYSRVLMLGSLIFSLATITNNILRAEGLASRAGFNVCFAAILNAALDPLWIYLFGVPGAAVSTIFSKLINLILGFQPYFAKRTQVTPSLNHFKIQFSLWREIIGIGFAAASLNIAGACLSFAVNKIIIYHTPGGKDSSEAALIIAVYLSQFKINMLSGYIAYSLHLGALPLLAIAHGGSKSDSSMQYRFRLILRTGFRWGYYVGYISLILLFLLARPLAYFFSDDTDFIDHFEYYQKVSAFGAFVIAPVLQLIGAFIASQQGGIAAFLLLCRSLLVIVPCYLIASLFVGTDGIAVGYTISEYITLFITWFVFVGKRESLHFRNNIKYLFVFEPRSLPHIPDFE